MQVDLSITCDEYLYIPKVCDDITLSIERRGTPSKLEFEVIRNDEMKLREGGIISLIVDDTKVFYGYIFSLRYSESDTISVTAYDQLRYLKNKDTYVYEKKTASQVIRMIADDFKLQCGSICNTAYQISRVEDNQSLFDIIETALDETLRVQKKLYVFYDNYGKLTLKAIDDMKRDDIVVTADNTESYSLSSTIDGETYNQIKLYFDNEKTGKRDIYIEKDSSNIKKWGLLQYYEKLDKGEDGKAKAQALLKLHNHVDRTLDFDGVTGVLGLRAGNSILFKLKVGDIELSNFLVIDKIKHHFSENEHTMDMTVIGGAIDG